MRVVTATSLFDGHDAAINIIRRILQSTGVEVIHLGHNRSVKEIIKAAVEEDVQGIAVSSYQGGHVEFFRYMVDLLKEEGAGHIKVFGGGGGVIVPEEITQLEKYGVAKIYSPADGVRLGMQGIVNHMVSQLDYSPIDGFELVPKELHWKNAGVVAHAITWVETNPKQSGYADIENKPENKGSSKIPVIGITGTGGAGKSSLTDELILRFLHDQPDKSIAVISCDPSRRKTGGALLGDRIRMNSLGNPRVYMRSLATRDSQTEIPAALSQVLQIVKAAGYDLAIVETAGIGQGDSQVVDMVDLSIYVMTSEFGAASQLEKIDMLDFADIVVVNKYEKQGAEDAVRDVRKQVQRNRGDFSRPPEDMPVFGTIASRFNDDGVTAVYHELLGVLNESTGMKWISRLPRSDTKTSSSKTVIIPPERIRYLAEISDTVREYHTDTRLEAERVRRIWHLEEAAKIISSPSASKDSGPEFKRLKKELSKAKKRVSPETRNLLSDWGKTKQIYTREDLVYSVRGRKIKQPLFVRSLADSRIPKVALPHFRDPGEVFRWLRKENLPGYFPYTGGVFPLKRVGEDPTRMFAGEGDPERTNRRFKLLSEGSSAKRLSTAFDSVTLYGCDPDDRPDIYGKVGNSGVSICTLDDMKVLYQGFDLCSPSTSVSMTINGPAPMMLAMYLNTAIDQQVDAFRGRHSKKPNQEEYRGIADDVLSRVRGTVQADILKEDQGQNTCIFSIDFALKMMGDIQEYFVLNNVRNFYSVSISGYHIAEAGANPITQLALTLSNGFTYVEYYLSRGMSLDHFGPNLSFFFSNGMDPEYTVIGRVARRIWAVAMREKYGASPRSQMLKYHIQTSGRSLHSQEVQFNDIRTTLQALCAVYDNCNSLHTNAFDEAITTPSPESVRRALAIQMIINREWGLAQNENMNQGSFIVEELTDLVEEAVLMEFDRIAARGGVLGAMETGYQRSRIQEESMRYEIRKHSGELPIIGVNTFLEEKVENGVDSGSTTCLPLSRATEEEKRSQLQRLRNFKQKHNSESDLALQRLQHVALEGGNIFVELMETVKGCTYAVGGQYRRNM